MAYLVVRIKGTVNIPQQAKKTLDGLNLDKRFRATIVPESAEYLGMLRKVKDEVAMSNLGGIKPWFALNPPKGGFKRKTKTQYMQDGILGDDGELVQIVKRML